MITINGKEYDEDYYENLSVFCDHLIKKNGLCETYDEDLEDIVLHMIEVHYEKDEELYTVGIDLIEYLNDANSIDHNYVLRELKKIVEIVRKNYRWY